MASLDITSYDPEELKSSLIAYMQSIPEFADFNYEGSTLNTLIDLLVRNSHYIAFLANMVSNESFLDTAQLRHNVVSHAQKLSYIPRSRTASTILVDLVVTPPDSYIENASTIEASPGRVWINSVDDTTYYFTNLSKFTLYRNESGDYEAFDQELKQGSYVRNEYIYYTEQGYVEILDENIDTSTLKVFIQESDSQIYQCVKIDDLVNVSKDGRNFFVSEATNGNYRIEFGKNILGIDPSNASTIIVEYVSTQNEIGNNVQTLSATSPIAQFSDITTTVKTPSYGGSDRESIEDIKFLAPKIYSTNNRAVKDTDYIPLMLRDFNFIRTANAWGGEKNEPPFYGRVFISAVPQDGIVILDYLKREIENKMNGYSVGSITTKFVDPEYFWIDLQIETKIDRTKTSIKNSEITPIIIERVNTYNTNNLKYFGVYYNNSELINNFKDIDYIETIEINKNISTNKTISPGIYKKYKFNFGNEIKENSVSMSGFKASNSSSSEEIYDESGEMKIKLTIGAGESVETIGTVDYENGTIEIDYNFIETGQLICTIQSIKDNFYTNRNQVIYIDDISVDYT